MNERLGRAGMLVVLTMLAPWLAAGAGAQEPKPAHGIAMHGDLKYGPDFAHFDYADPAAKKGGVATFEAIGSFDSFNPFIIKGEAAAGVGLLYETLTAQSGDEPFSEYGLLAESIEMPADRSWVAFTLRKEARWHDGQPVTVDDVIWSLETLKSKGTPFYRFYYQNVLRAEPAGERRVKMVFDGTTNRELPLIIGQLPVLPKHYFASRDFEKTTLEPPLGSGPYRIKSFDPGRSVVYERVPDYWGASIPVNLGRNNFDQIRYEYFRDSNVSLEAFKAGAYDLRVENTSKLWATAYTGPAFEAGWIKKEEITREGGTGMQGFAFNLRRPKFQDAKVRQALAYAFDFEWTNKTLFYGLYARTKSYFSNSDLASSGLPSEAELALLEPHRAQLPPEVFTQTYQPPATDGSGNNRDNLRAALQLLREAGYAVQNGKLQNAEGQNLDFEILVSNPAFERIVGPFAKNLERLGIKASIRTVDPAQYQNRMSEFDYDMTVETWGQSMSPGNEQRDFWGSEAADRPGSRNTLGIKDPVIDDLVDQIIQAKSRDDLVTACQALDRVLLWGHYVIPNWHSRSTRIAYWDKFQRPKTDPIYGVDLYAWWIDEARVAEIAARQRATGGAKATQ